MAERLIAAFGESKNITEWLADPRCAVSVNILRRRLNDGWDAESALATPARLGRQPDPGIDATAAARLKELSLRVAAGPKVHRYTPADGPEAVAIRARNDEIRKALADGHTLGAVAAVTGLSDEQVRTIRDAG